MIELLPVILKGFFLGMVLSVMAGPMFFSLVQLGMERGFKAGAVLGAGQWLSDFILIGLAYWLGSFVQPGSSFEFWMGLAGGILLATFGLLMLLINKETDPNASQITRKDLFGYFSAGFLINSINPFPYFFWISTTAQGVAEQYTLVKFVVFYITVMGMVIATDLGKVFLAKKIKPYLKPQYLLLLKQISGIALLLFGIALIVKVCL